MAEFLYSCIEQTIDEIIPSEVDYLHKYDEFKLTTEEVDDVEGLYHEIFQGLAVIQPVGQNHIRN